MPRTDGTVIRSKNGSEQICVGNILYFGAPIPTRFVDRAMKEVLKNLRVKAEYKISHRHGWNKTPVYTYCLLNNAEVYAKLLPATRVIQVDKEITEDAMSPKTKRRVKSIKERLLDFEIDWDKISFDELKNVNMWDAAYLEDELESYTIDRVNHREEYYPHPLRPIQLRELTSDELFQIRDICPELIDDKRKIVHLRPNVSYYYTPDDNCRADAISASVKFITKTDKEQIRAAFAVCNTYGDQRYPKMELRNKMLTMYFHPHSQDALLALCFQRDFRYVNEQGRQCTLKFRYARK